ncbi:hypothetical protein [Dehalogenimonas etheniformans]|uniref:Uncharacterized protein n=1 Tax=Dehalogenimonas etheniformans TaxID=1536648 RepID=A0A2P5P4Z6_9CHLR|nr:hypothetical protein [Dehalogenimonas etheniformans]PPD57371.1 hypothetical protein JP09_010045 [Dehalogenimonas etheniformans]QNT75221.1 hypothetical protein HX448_00190 [Dehalogenimonas etheniformans]
MAVTKIHEFIGPHGAYTICWREQEGETDKTIESILDNLELTGEIRVATREYIVNYLKTSPATFVLGEDDELQHQACVFSMGFEAARPS